MKKTEKKPLSNFQIAKRIVNLHGDTLLEGKEPYKELEWQISLALDQAYNKGYEAGWNTRSKKEIKP